MFVRVWRCQPTAGREAELLEDERLVRECRALADGEHDVVSVEVVP